MACGRVVAASIVAAVTPSVPLASSAQAAHSPASESCSPATATRGPVATNGISRANTTNGASMAQPVTRRRAGTPTATTTTASTSACAA